jgi:hypothetical protein
LLPKQLTVAGDLVDWLSENWMPSCLSCMRQRHEEVEVGPNHRQQLKGTEREKV